MPLVSMIVPVYNAEKTVDRCVNSILNQTYKDFELILLDDGSTDASGAVCDACAEKDARIRVVHKEKSGSLIPAIRELPWQRGNICSFLTVTTGSHRKPQAYLCVRPQSINVIW